MKKIKNKCPKKFPKVLIEIRPSKMLKGQIGVFAVRSLSQGTIIGDVSFLNEDLFLTWKDYDKLDKETKKVVYNYCLGSPRGLFAPIDLNYISIPWNFNHSCSGNVGFDRKGNFIIRKNTRKGEELRYDYGLAEGNPNFKMKCKCGSKNCRKIITGNDWKDEKFRKNNLEYMIPEFRKIKK